MIKYKVIIKESDTPLGFIGGKDKRELSLQLVELCHKNDIKIKEVKLECVQFDKQENL